MRNPMGFLFACLALAAPLARAASTPPALGDVPGLLRLAREAVVAQRTLVPVGHDQLFEVVKEQIAGALPRELPSRHPVRALLSKATVHIGMQYVNYGGTAFASGSGFFIDDDFSKLHTAAHVVDFLNFYLNLKKNGDPRFQLFKIEMTLTNGEGKRLEIDKEDIKALSVAQRGGRVDHAVIDMGSWSGRLSTMFSSLESGPTRPPFGGTLYIAGFPANIENAAAGDSSADVFKQARFAVGDAETSLCYSPGFMTTLIRSKPSETKTFLHYILGDYFSKFPSVRGAPTPLGDDYRVEEIPFYNVFLRIPKDTFCAYPRQVMISGMSGGPVLDADSKAVGMVVRSSDKDYSINITTLR